MDPGFPKGVVPTPRGGGVGHQSVIRPNFPENCMNMNEESWVEREGERPKFVFVGPPLVQRVCFMTPNS